ncbi:MAG: glycosyltransferase [Comamonadaceae bacterium]|nr:glycosyltransferase [Comamonadaceae bacterium]
MVHPAEMEGLGVALLQAAACGLPIVAGRAGGIPGDRAAGRQRRAHRARRHRPRWRGI